MLSGKPLFPGRDYHHQLTLILDVLGTPSLDDFYQINSHRSRDYLRALPFKKKKKYSEMYPNAKPLAIDLMEKCLTFNPKKRITVEDGLAHPVSLINAQTGCPVGARTDLLHPFLQYLAPYHDETDEPSSEVIPPEFFHFDNIPKGEQPLGREALKSGLHQLIS